MSVGGLTRRSTDYQEGHMELSRYRMRLVFSCATIGLISIPLILRLVPPNGVYGFRTSLTRSSPDIWYAANVFSGWALLAAAVISGVTLLMLPETAKRWSLMATFLLPILAAVAASFLYLERLV